MDAMNNIAADPSPAVSDSATSKPTAHARERNYFPLAPRVLSIAGTDPSGGAGAEADLKSIFAAGGYGMSVITSLVAQNTQGVRAVHSPGTDFLREQLGAVFDDVKIDAVKIGMLGDRETTEVVQSWMAAHPVPVLVFDPVMIATSGDRLLAQDAEAAVKLFASCLNDFADCAVITPNIPELAILCGEDPADSFDEAVGQAQAWSDEHGVNVIVKGGHLNGEEAGNAWVAPQTSAGATSPLYIASSPRVDSPHTHGTGCSLSSALATRLGGGDSSDAALRWATTWLHGAIAQAAALRVGRGHGPVDHAFRAREAGVFTAEK